MNFSLRINGETHQVESEPEVPLLWVLRDVLGLTGTKFGCGVAACGACTVHVEGRAMRTCTLAGVGRRRQGNRDNRRACRRAPAGPAGRLDPPPGTAMRLLPVRACLMAAAALLAERAQPSDADIDRAITNICRCGTYQRVRRAIHDAAGSLGNV